MPKGILYVESRPASPEQAADYHQWYNETHLPEMLSVDGFVSARRFEPVEGDGPFIAIYEFDTDDLDATRARLADATKSGRNSTPVGVSSDPPPMVRYFLEIASLASNGD
jgi:hypothetical protein